MKYFIFILSALSANICLASEEAELFFKKYQFLGETFDTSVSELYSDSAKIHAYRYYPGGLEKHLELNGAQWKALIEGVMPVAKAKNDKSTFAKISISKTEKGYRIKADRYSHLKCYTDKGYYMEIAKVDDKLLIIEEYLETQAKPNCKN